MKLIMVLGAFLFVVMAQSEVLNLKAEYAIPVKNATDFQLNKFTLSNYVIDIKSPTDVSLYFAFPEDMVGRTDQQFAFKLTSVLENETKVLTGPQGKAVCKGKWIQAECTIILKKVRINEKKLKEILNQKYGPSESDRQFQLLKDFGNDPIGASKIL